MPESWEKNRERCAMVGEYWGDACRKAAISSEKSESERIWGQLKAEKNIHALVIIIIYQVYTPRIWNCKS